MYDEGYLSEVSQEITAQLSHDFPNETFSVEKTREKLKEYVKEFRDLS
jgi:hypothetical protein